MFKSLIIRFVVPLTLAVISVLLFGVGKSLAAEAVKETRSGTLITSAGRPAININDSFYQFVDVPLTAISPSVGFRAEVSGFWQGEEVTVGSVVVTENVRETIYLKDVVAPTGGIVPPLYSISGILAVRSMKPAVVMGGNENFFGYQSVVIEGPGLESVQQYLGRAVTVHGDVGEGWGCITIRAERVILSEGEAREIFVAV